MVTSKFYRRHNANVRVLFIEKIIEADGKEIAQRKLTCFLVTGPVVNRVEGSGWSVGGGRRNSGGFPIEAFRFPVSLPFPLPSTMLLVSHGRSGHNVDLPTLDIRIRNRSPTLSAIGS